nr:DNA adenine methylase [Pyrinomonadaceae bacterium]
KTLSPLIPYAVGYIEPFVGAGSVLLIREKSKFEVYNDKFEHLVNLFRVLRGPNKCAALKRLCELTLYARSEKYYAWNMLCKGTYRDDVERAWAFYITMNMGFGGKFEGSWGSGVSDNGYMPRKYASRLPLFKIYLDRLRETQIECKDGAQIVKLYDNPNHVFYCDPPYIAASRKGKGDYENEMSDAQHETFLQACLAAKGAVIISGYPSELYQDLLSGWEARQISVVCHAVGKTQASNLKGEGIIKENFKRTEVIWRNARAVELCNKKRDLF